MPKATLINLHRILSNISIEIFLKCFENYPKPETEEAFTGTKPHAWNQGVMVTGRAQAWKNTKMIPLFKTFAGGPLCSGIVNGTAPHPVRLSEMCDQLGQVMGRPSWLPLPVFVLRAVFCKGATIVLEGQKLLPVKAKEHGFHFKYPFVKDALRDIISSGST
ncbi:hypothetical protein KFK09_014862 [Dendrobium nobile]|uniref:DUF1731 domain-containing protein n=1 Tax=Dendrobium nobile TaxID=94219 RepID=A0A8T3B933_DENNO|nr:hypothetical protein KFK09_014862 [Dendrobium nobile]